MTNERLHPVIILYHVDFTDADDVIKWDPQRGEPGPAIGLIEQQVVKILEGRHLGDLQS